MDYYYLHFDEIDSTNTYLKNHYQKLDNLTFVSTDYQSQGKGRNDRTWWSKKGENLMFSLLIKDQKMQDMFPYLSMATAVEVAKILEKHGLTNVSIKWPNDVIVNDKKICGILLEGQVPDYSVIGVGLNVNQKGFPNDLRRPATSMAKELNNDINIEELKKEIFASLANNLPKCDKDGYLIYLNSHNYLLYKAVCANIKFTGEVIGIDDNFALVINHDGKPVHISSGEIEII